MASFRTVEVSSDGFVRSQTVAILSLATDSDVGNRRSVGDPFSLGQVQNGSTPETVKSNSVNLPPQSGPNSMKFRQRNDPETTPVPNSYSLEKFRLYGTRARFYLIGNGRNKKIFRVLKIDRMEPSDLNISEDHVVYPPQEVKSLLQRIAEEIVPLEG